MKSGLLAQLLASTASIALIVTGVPVLAQSPQAPTIAAGSIAVTRQGNTTVVTQGTEKGIIDWRSFSIGSQEAVRFDQPGRSSVTLNRVTGSEISRLDGSLTATGQVWLANPNGVIVGPGGQINVGGLLATTGRIDPQEFQRSGRALIGQIPENSRIVNSGAIVLAEGGYAALAAASIRNDGMIVARRGTVALGAGKAMTIDFAGDRLIQYQVTQPLDQSSSEGEPLISSQGSIDASSGAVLMTARAAKGVMDSVINLNGHVVANQVRVDGGTVSFGDGGIVQVSGKIDASNAAGVGGTVAVLGEKVGLMDGASIDASGATGGGTVLIGGDWQGKGAGQNAIVSFVSPSASITVDATLKGDGGKAVVWADDTTRFNGMISARGGIHGGTGGQVETSGKRTLVVGANAGVTAAARTFGAAAGAWLLDPTDITIQSSPGAESLTLGSFAPSGGSTTIQDSVISTALLTTDVTLQTTSLFGGNGDITFASGTISHTGASPRTLKLLADRDIILNSGTKIESSGQPLTIILNSGIGFTTQLSVLGGISNAGVISTAGGAISFVGGQNGTLAARGASITGIGVVNSGQLSSGGGAILISGEGGTTGANQHGVFLNGGSIDAAGGTITIMGTGAGSSGVNDGVHFAAPSVITATGSGSVVVKGSAGSNGVGISLNGLTGSTVDGAFSLVGDSISESGTNSIGAGTNGYVQFRPLTSAVPIDVNGTSAPGTLGLSGLLSITSGPLQIGGPVGALDFTGNIEVVGAVTLSQDITLRTKGGSVRSTASIDGAQSLTIDAGTGTVSFGGDVGSTVQLSSLSITAAATTNIPMDIVFSTSGDQTFTTSFLLNGNGTGSAATFQTGGGNVTVSGAINSMDASNSASLAFNAGLGAVTLSGGIGNITPVNTIAHNSPTGTLFASGTIRSKGDQNYSGPVQVIGATTFKSTAGGVAFLSDLDGGFDVAVSSDATTTFADHVGVNLALASLTITGPTLFENDADEVRTTGSQSYSGAVVFANTNVSAMALYTTGGDIFFNDTVDAGDSGSPQSLSISAGSGAVSFAGTLGGTTPLASLTQTGTGSVSLNGTYSTVGSQSYQGKLVLNGPTTIVASDAILLGGASGTGSLAVSGPATVSGTFTTSGAQSYAGAITLAADTSFVSGGALFFDGDITGPEDLGISAGTSITLGNSAPITIDTTSGGGGGDQIYSGLVILKNDVNMDSSSSPITFNGPITSSTAGANSLTTSTSGTVTFSDSVGAFDPLAGVGSGALKSLNVFQVALVGTAVLKANVTTDLNQFYDGVVQIAGPVTLSAANGNIHFGETTDSSSGSPQPLTILTPNGNPNFNLAIGKTNPLQALTYKGSGDIFVHATSQLGQVSVETPGNAVIQDSSPAGLTLLASSVGGTLSITTDGPVTQSGALVVKTLVLDGYAGYTLNDPGNNISLLTGYVSALTLVNGPTVGLTIGSAGGFNGLLVDGDLSLTQNGQGLVFLDAVSAGSMSLTAANQITATASTIDVTGTGPLTISANGGTLAAVTIDGLTGTDAAALINVISGSIQANSVIKFAPAQVAVTATTASIPSLPSMGPVVSVLPPVTPILPGTAPSFSPTGAFLGTSPDLSGTGLSVTSSASSVPSTLISAIDSLFAIGNLTAGAGDTRDVTLGKLLIPSVNFSIPLASPFSPVGTQPLTTAAGVALQVANTLSGALVPVFLPIVAETNAILASARTIKVDAADTGGAGGQVIANFGERLGIVIPGLVNEEDHRKYNKNMLKEPPLAQLPSIMNEEYLLD